MNLETLHHGNAGVFFLEVSYSFYSFIAVSFKRLVVAVLFIKNSASWIHSCNENAHKGVVLKRFCTLTPN